MAHGGKKLSVEARSWIHFPRINTHDAYERRETGDIGSYCSRLVRGGYGFIAIRTQYGFIAMLFVRMNRCDIKAVIMYYKVYY